MSEKLSFCPNLIERILESAQQGMTPEAYVRFLLALTEVIADRLSVAEYGTDADVEREKND